MEARFQRPERKIAVCDIPFSNVAGRPLDFVIAPGVAVANFSSPMDYEAVIGLETHVQLKTKSKMWCGCANEFGAPPNTHVCPVCLGLPGVLPVANEEALRLTVLTGLLLNSTVSAYAKFDRKNYFYPDMPKNYQITQYDRPSAAMDMSILSLKARLPAFASRAPIWKRMWARIFISSAKVAWTSTAPAYR